MTRVAALDCGTNSLRLLVADVDPAAGSLVDVDRRVQIVRLGEGVDRTGRLSHAAVGRTLGVLRTYAERCRDLDVRAVRMIATSAIRDAANRGTFVAGVLEVLGVAPEVVSGEAEAALSFAGATRELGADGAPYLVVDVGGGSTELVLGGPAGVTAGCSVDVGSVRLTERHLATDPPTPAEVAAATADVDVALDAAARTVAYGATRTVVGVAGSVTTVAAYVLRLDRYRPERIHRARLAATDVRSACRDLLAMTRAERAALPYMQPGRADVIGAGALVWSRVVERVGLPGSRATAFSGPGLPPGPRAGARLSSAGVVSCRQD